MTNEKIIKALKTIKKMLIDRKIFDSDIHLFDDILMKNKLFEKQITINLNDVQIVFYLYDKNKIKEISEIFLKNDFRLYLLIVNKNFNQSDLKKRLGDAKFSILQIFNIMELQFNISEHLLVPKHEIINNVEIEELKKYHKLNNINQQLPIINKTDPMVKYLNIKPGQIVKITRISPSSGEAFVWRICI